MSWIEPKTDWTESDYFNAEDYNRIIGNLAFLKTFTEGLFEAFDLQDMGEEKTYASLIYAREINIIESNLETINMNTYGFNLGEKTIYKDNGNTPLFSEINRIEGAILRLYTTLQAHREALPRLAFTFGGQKGIRL